MVNFRDFLGCLPSEARQQKENGGGESDTQQRMARCGGDGCVGYRQELRGDEGEGDGGDDQPCNGQTTAAAGAARIG